MNATDLATWDAVGKALDAVEVALNGSSAATGIGRQDAKMVLIGAAATLVAVGVGYLAWNYTIPAARAVGNGASAAVDNVVSIFGRRKATVTEITDYSDVGLAA